MHPLQRLWTLPRRFAAARHPCQVLPSPQRQPPMLRTACASRLPRSPRTPR